MLLIKPMIVTRWLFWGVQPPVIAEQHIPDNGFDGHTFPRVNVGLTDNCSLLGLRSQPDLTIPENLKQLKEHVRVPEDGKRATPSAFEIRGRELVLDWRNLAPKETIKVPVDLICRVPGEYSGPASRAYLYYNDDHKHWVKPLKVSIAAAK